MEWNGNLSNMEIYLGHIEQSIKILHLGFIGTGTGPEKLENSWSRPDSRNQSGPGKRKSLLKIDQVLKFIRN